MKVIFLCTAMLLTAPLAYALTAEERRIKQQYGPKYNASAVIHLTNECIDQYMLLSDNPDVSVLKPWCEQKVINGWEPFSRTEMQKRLKARQSSFPAGAGK